MSEYIFLCPACKKEVKSDTQYIGRAAECPNCNGVIVKCIIYIFVSFWCH